MKFDSAAEALRWYVNVCAVGVFSSGAFNVEKDDETLEHIGGGPSDPMLWQNLIHTKIDIERAFLTCFPQPWIQRIMLHWAVDGYDEAITKTHNASPFHKRKGRTSHKDDLGVWIWRFTDKLVEYKCLRRQAFNQNRHIANSA